jgi:hypothetical protein
MLSAAPHLYHLGTVPVTCRLLCTPQADRCRCCFPPPQLALPVPSLLQLSGGQSMGMTCQSSSGAVRGCQRRCPSCSRQGNLPAGRRVPLRSSACPSACLPAWPNVDACFFATLAGLCCCCSLQVLKLESRKPRPERGLTVVTQLSLERFQMLENQCGTWPFQVGGPTEGRGVGYGVGLVLMLAAASVCLPACPPCLPARTDLCRAFHPPSCYSATSQLPA